MSASVGSAKEGIKETKPSQTKLYWDSKLIVPVHYGGSKQNSAVVVSQDVSLKK